MWARNPSGTWATYHQWGVGSSPLALSNYIHSANISFVVLELFQHLCVFKLCFGKFGLMSFSAMVKDDLVACAILSITYVKIKLLYRLFPSSLSDNDVNCCLLLPRRKPRCLTHEHTSFLFCGKAGVTWQVTVSTTSCVLLHIVLKACLPMCCISY